ncbi:hypothetical protein ACSS6W_005742 [Trichoderma asperelloides]
MQKTASKKMGAEDAIFTSIQIHGAAKIDEGDISHHIQTTPTQQILHLSPPWQQFG